ncbi:hypothetical protein ACLB2K_041576 [Fragaria x ananassa]
MSEKKSFLESTPNPNGPPRFASLSVVSTRSPLTKLTRAPPTTTTASLTRVFASCTWPTMEKSGGLTGEHGTHDDVDLAGGATAESVLRGMEGLNEAMRRRREGDRRREEKEERRREVKEEREL